MRQLSFRISDDDYAGIERVADFMGLNRTDIIRLAIRKFLEANKSENRLNLQNRANNHIGAVESGIPDLGLNHRKHIINKIKEY